MTSIYEICADEAWTHTNKPLNRYWCFFGGLMGSERSADRLETELRKCIESHHPFRREVKWSRLDSFNSQLYTELVDIFFENLIENDLRYRQFFLDRSYVWKRDTFEDRSELDVQYRMYYQFLKHHFGLKYLPFLSNSDHYLIHVRLDEHSSQQHKKKLTEFVHDLPRILERSDMEIRVRFVDSKKLRRLQVCDILMGAAGSYGNRLHKRRDEGQRGMKPRQKVRYQLAKHIYDRFREIDARERGSKAFSWFESTGRDGAMENRFRHKLRIWKFIPENHERDLGWKNKNLDSQGRYCGPKVTSSNQ